MIQGYYILKFRPSWSELAALNPIEYNVEGMAKKNVASHAFKALKDDDLKDCEKIYITITENTFRK